VALVVKSKNEGMKLSLYGEDLSVLLEPESFPDLYTLNFHLQTLAKKHNISKGLMMVIHDVEQNNVRLSLARDDDGLFID
jgi:hypothetical protein